MGIVPVHFYELLRVYDLGFAAEEAAWVLDLFEFYYVSFFRLLLFFRFLLLLLFLFKLLSNLIIILHHLDPRHLDRIPILSHNIAGITKGRFLDLEVLL